MGSNAGERHAGLRLLCYSGILYHNSKTGPNFPFPEPPPILLTLPTEQGKQQGSEARTKRALGAGPIRGRGSQGPT